MYESDDEEEYHDIESELEEVTDLLKEIIQLLKSDFRLGTFKKGWSYYETHISSSAHGGVDYRDIFDKLYVASIDLPVIVAKDKRSMERLNQLYRKIDWENRYLDKEWIFYMQLACLLVYPEAYGILHDYHFSIMRFTNETGRDIVKEIDKGTIYGKFALQFWKGHDTNALIDRKWEQVEDEAREGIYEEKQSTFFKPF
jgi:hypothetical protein